MKYKVLFNAVATKTGSANQGDIVDEADLGDAKGMLEMGALEAVEEAKETKKTKADDKK